MPRRIFSAANNRLTSMTTNSGASCSKGLAYLHIENFNCHTAYAAMKKAIRKRSGLCQRNSSLAFLPGALDLIRRFARETASSR